MNFARVASYRPILHLLSDVYYIHLSAAGFKYVGGKYVECVECGKNVNIDTFILADPHGQEFHNTNCSYIHLEKTNVSSLVNEQNLSKAFEHVKPYASSEANVRSSELDSDFTQLSSEPSVGLTEESSSLLDDSAASIKDQVSHDVTLANEDVETKPPLTLDNEELDKKRAVSNDVRVVSGLSSTLHFDDSSLFVPEIEVTSSKNSTPEDIRSECKKNPGHFAYFPITKLRLEQIPSHTRDAEALRFFQLFGQLVVRVVQTPKRKDGHRNDKTTERSGTGCLSLSDDIAESQDWQSNRLGKLGKYMTHLVKRNRWLLFIITSKHLVKNDEDAVSSRAEFFYDEPSKSGLKSVKGLSVRNSDIIGDNSTLLICETSDVAFVQKITKAKQEVLDIASRLPRRVKKSMTKKLYIISHPHGKEKVLSYGDSVSVMFALRSKVKCGIQVIEPFRIRINEIGRESRLNIRKAYHYAIDTCDGCSGAPVIGFKKVTPNSESNGDGYLLDVWVHNGVNIVHSLGCSVLRELTEEDIFLLNDRSQTVTGQSDSDSDTERSTETPNYSSVLKVQTSPFYPDFTCYQKRLESCATWQFSHIHQPQMIALAGFFYSGYSDCVKCFYCGLGLKSWKPGDDLHTEHLKNKPTCIYLKRLSSVYTLKEGAEVTSDAVKNVENLLQTSYSSEALTLNSDSTGSSVEDVLGLLRLENRKLREQVLCKVCHLAPVKDLFLPCGELIACTECSKLLTHCASCGKQILATITTYFV
ncbi:uncharacterized protein LOC106078794 isoform X1 [Biomphalaria glabrata]|uniref:Uncharacterized protein LOC106078794 isoform X1 n=1 Tax=Biomphalaria glabrata TaxID=6526 RepID=A0A9W3AN47_BIOGL|nr:uncharacterized protein LOC106078794 isoform X1 [Biomphalaria glabrata]XP_055888651.1 uncharacterized protein LOC106078794 isoform X1 [Biomphalaria glabrata]XP_055888652.1 uncharacterized protein LOC106078794 isoform X1 [Biomphalaria glabrata]XP_055888653.1 uncharacterized protein LOC106078794 isoform X1 [Biomphalaria glabrata]XP_055888654.1 uncharacterized protein LOC106078794 isoform X1 [Biomphalaria glabrata]XP_055888655.1 uncharacterized protein LOC106078794 isoform X1 [Biomphalaria gla